MDTSSETSSNYILDLDRIANLRHISSLSHTSTSSSHSHRQEGSSSPRQGHGSSASSILDSSEENLPSDLNQFQTVFNWNAYDDSESECEEISYELDEEYEQEKKEEKQHNLWVAEEITRQRETNARHYYDTRINKNSIFNYKGLHFTHFNHELIKFIFTPSAFCNKYICVNRKYHITLIYDKKWWILKRYHQVPDNSEILELFEHTIVDDKAVMKVIDLIYHILVRNTKEQIQTRKNKHKDYLSGKEVDFNSDDEKLLLSSDERERRQKKREEIWKRMLPPN